MLFTASEDLTSTLSSSMISKTQKLYLQSQLQQVDHGPSSPNVESVPNSAIQSVGHRFIYWAVSNMFQNKR
jgi:hypothetical protein